MHIQISWLLQKPTDLDLHCLQKQGISGFSRTRVKIQLIQVMVEFLKFYGPFHNALISAIFFFKYKDKFCDFMFVFLQTKSFWKRVLPFWSKFFHFRVDMFQKGDKKKMTVLLPLKLYPFHLN